MEIKKLEKEGKISLKTPCQLVSIEGSEKIDSVTIKFDNGKTEKMTQTKFFDQHVFFQGMFFFHPRGPGDLILFFFSNSNDPPGVPGDPLGSPGVPWDPLGSPGSPGVPRTEEVSSDPRSPPPL